MVFGQISVPPPVVGSSAVPLVPGSRPRRVPISLTFLTIYLSLSDLISASPKKFEET